MTEPMKESNPTVNKSGVNIWASQVKTKAN